MTIGLIATPAQVLPPLPPSVTVIRWGPGATYEAAACAALIVLSDGLDATACSHLARWLSERDVIAVEVRAERWDGHSDAPLSAVCKGVISGFGEAGIIAAVRFLEDRLAAG